MKFLPSVCDPSLSSRLPGTQFPVSMIVLCCQGVVCQFVRTVAMNRSIYSHAECLMRRFKLKISASATCQNNHATL
jgi:hypothetical protein